MLSAVWKRYLCVTIRKCYNLHKHNGSYLSRIFKQHTGLSLHLYILDQRDEQAKRCLLPGKSVGDTCSQSGFCDCSNFIRTFKNKVGVSPGSFKKTSLADHN